MTKTVTTLPCFKLGQEPSLYIAPEVCKLEVIVLNAGSRKLAILFVVHAKVMMTEHLALLGSCVRGELCEE